LLAILNLNIIKLKIWILEIILIYYKILRRIYDFFILILELGIGSFLSVCIYRISRDESISYPLSSNIQSGGLTYGSEAYLGSALSNSIHQI